MIKKLLPILLLLIGTGAGVGAGVFLRPAPEPEPVEHAEEGEETKAHVEEHPKKAGHGEDDGPVGREYVKMENQFVIPVVDDGAVSALVLLALSIELETGHREAIIRLEPKLRDSFLQVLFDHANVGGFRGHFTDKNNLDVLRAALREVAVRDAGSHVTDVLIRDIARQDY